MILEYLEDRSILNESAFRASAKKHAEHYSQEPETDDVRINFVYSLDDEKRIGIDKLNELTQQVTLDVGNAVREKTGMKLQLDTTVHTMNMPESHKLVSGESFVISSPFTPNKTISIFQSLHPNPALYLTEMFEKMGRINLTRGLFRLAFGSRNGRDMFGHDFTALTLAWSEHINGANSVDPWFLQSFYKHPENARVDRKVATANLRAVIEQVKVPLKKLNHEFNEARWDGNGLFVNSLKGRSPASFWPNRDEPGT